MRVQNLPTFIHEHKQTGISRTLPSVKGPDVAENYSTAFQNPQYFVEGGPPKWTRELKICLLQISLIETSSVPRSLAENCSLARERRGSRSTILSAFGTPSHYRDPLNNKSHPPEDIEYRILGIIDLKKVEKDGEPLPLNIEQISQDLTPVPATSRRSSGLTSSSTKTGKARSRDDMPCFIYFFESRDKKAFLQILRQRAPGWVQGYVSGFQDLRQTRIVNATYSLLKAMRYSVINAADRRRSIKL
jgi:hypothetical protein